MEPAGQVPIAFQVHYDDGAVQSSHRYAVRATIRVAGGLLYTTTQTLTVLTQSWVHQRRCARQG